ncbi:hypothetical protein TWF225_006565 [Orbilia oligospora]|nr:hypothetical protein TWF225_006565 [Orbilia oligospora]KAF3265080.1 hypothetical protein TWF217_002729 [Orbilia oligospora]KAF3268049.1 hypothetical protein TWF128_008063 [Orbilia oligospora]KAF3290074.1 hypothetical protein TWF132_007271 [Orbilia oligospora]
MEDNHEWIQALEDFNRGISQPCAASSLSYQETNIIHDPQHQPLDAMELDWPHLILGSPTSEADPSFDIDDFLHESYNVLGLGPGEEIIHNAGSQDHMALTGSNSTLNQTPESEYSGPGEIILAIPQSAEPLKPLKVVQRKQRKYRQGTRYQAKTWNEEPYSKVFRLEKQKKRPRTSEENANKRLITQFGPCLPCSRSKKRCSYNSENPKECCARCQRLEMSSSLSTYRLPCVRIHLDKNILGFSGQLPAAIAGSRAYITSVVEEIINSAGNFEQHYDFMALKMQKRTRMKYTAISKEMVVFEVLQVPFSIFGSLDELPNDDTDQSKPKYMFSQPIYLALLSAIHPRTINLSLNRFWQGELSLDEMTQFVIMVDVLDFILCAAYCMMDSLLDFIAGSSNGFILVSPISLYWRHVLISNVLTPLRIMTRLARERFSLKQMSPASFVSNLDRAYHFLYNSCHASNSREPQPTKGMPFPDPRKLYDPEIVGGLLPKYRIYKPSGTYKVSKPSLVSKPSDPWPWVHWETAIFPDDDGSSLCRAYRVDIPESVSAVQRTLEVTVMVR